MSDWAGFTEADIKRMEHGENGKDAKPKIVKPVTAGSRRTPQQAAKRTNSGKQRSQRKANNSVPIGARLSKPENRKQNIDENRQEIPEVAPKPNNNNNEEVKQVTDTAPPPQKEKIQPEIIVDEETIQKKEKLKLEDVHIRQKQMEERNRRKREMLAKEIAQRKKKASAESHKLIKIQGELNKLDQLLNCDVSILRDKIEEACFSFMSAQKRFKKAEAEYVAAKMDLHSKTEIKEDLTEHLFNLIQANEERKAKKLEELMSQLNVEGEELEAREEQERIRRKEIEEEEKRKSELEMKMKAEKEKLGETNSENSVKTEESKPTIAVDENLHGETKEKAEI